MNHGRIKEKKLRLHELYTEFERIATPYAGMAVCRKGCSDCCTSVGDVDATTLEAFFILEHIRSLPSPAQKEISKRLKQHRREKEKSRFVRCAFLDGKNACAIYHLRPFSCRRLYSLEVCGESGPTVHRRIWELGEETAFAIQTLDDNGYSGHLAHILQLLGDARFFKIYLEGSLAPDDVRDFGLKYNIIVNKFITDPPAGV